MRKLLLLATLVALLVAGPGGPVFSQEESPNLSLVFMGAGMVDDEFENPTGGLAVGAIKSIAGEQDVFVRVVYSKFNLTPGEPMQSLKPSLIWKMAVGKNWHLWLVPAGADVYLSGENRDVDMFVGAGAQRRIWTMAEGNGFNLFGELSFTDADAQKYGNFLQFNFGLVFDYPKKK